MAKADETLSISFELSEADLDFFRARFVRARQKSSPVDEAAAVRAAKELVTSAAASAAPAFVRVRFDTLRILIDMIEDQAWRLEGEHRTRVQNALAYFAEPDDLIPDKIPGVGYIDDAIVIELVAQELGPEIEAYRSFLAFREARAGADGKVIDGQRDQLQRRMRRRGRQLRGKDGRGRTVPFPSLLL
jgi:uncharacterized membrane protein YkvA (DUF1232 family)